MDGLSAVVKMTEEFKKKEEQQKKETVKTVQQDPILGLGFSARPTADRIDIKSTIMPIVNPTAVDAYTMVNTGIDPSKYAQIGNILVPIAIQQQFPNITQILLRIAPTLKSFQYDNGVYGDLMYAVDGITSDSSFRLRTFDISTFKFTDIIIASIQNNEITVSYMATNL